MYKIFVLKYLLILALSCCALWVNAQQINVLVYESEKKIDIGYYTMVQNFKIDRTLAVGLSYNTPNLKNEIGILVSRYHYIEAGPGIFAQDPYKRLKQYKFYFIQAMLGKQFNSKYFLFRYGVNMPIYYRYNYTYETHLLNDNLAKIYSRLETEPNMLLLGLNMYGSIHLKVASNLYLGTDLNFGFLTHIGKGKRNFSEYELTSNNEEIFHTHSDLSSTFLLEQKINGTLNLRYSFKYHKK